MATPGIDSLGNRRTPERNSPLLGGAPIYHTTPATVTAGSTHTLTAAEMLKGLVPVNCTDASTTTLSTADLLAAAIPGLAVGDWFEVQIINYGDSTITLAVGTGITNKSIDSGIAILTCTATSSLRFALVCTGLAQPGDPTKSNAFDFYGYGSVASATS